MKCSLSTVVTIVTTVTIVTVASACGTLSVAALPEAPAATASLHERDMYYEKRRPLGVVGQANAANNFAWARPARLPAVVLADGSRVAEPYALLPAVDEGSATAAAVRRADDIKLLTNVVYTASTVAITSGLVALVVSPGLLFNGDVATGYGLYAAGSAVSLAGCVGLVWATDLAEEAEAEKMTAFLLYDGDLRRRLALVRPTEGMQSKWLAAPVRATQASMAPPPLTPPLKGQPDAADE